MADLDDLDHRVSRLEHEVAHLRTSAQHATDVAGNAHNKAMTAEAAHHKNIELLNALHRTQAEHAQVLAEHSRRFDAVDRRLDAIDEKLGGLATGTHAVEQLLTRLVEDEGPAGTE